MNFIYSIALLSALAFIAGQGDKEYYYAKISCSPGGGNIIPTPGIIACPGYTLPKCGRATNGEMTAILYCDNSATVPARIESTGFVPVCGGKLIYCG